MEDNIEIETKSRKELRGAEEEVPTQNKEEIVGFQEKPGILGEEQLGAHATSEP